ncbi:hypothetical protein KR009_002226, partial [Drosophila setifemur]
VSSVLLYGIPIVSLYIEGQERLCLAQISNTLLKQFSYNEIHNRRVALGITCVQCTPVQLEILRRAGAMPVSSRRCGMITRREAERLCKSFLGDNTPPRLPEDFAFNVQHKCAWGCRGSFLPSRYNSSRAKCIKCAYCGMFFSPNKFIFHSHRITNSDRYVQPDAANFNSWRRHMTLSGNVYDEKIVHAWEDVKAMFNGGTRKRLISNTGNSVNNRNEILQTSFNPQTIGVGGNSSSSPITFESETKNLTPEELPDRSLDRQYNYRTVAAAAAVVGVTAVAAATVGVPFNLQRSSDYHDLSIMPISRNFVVDYMWQQKNQHQQYSKKLSGGDSSESCSKSWVRPEANVSLPTVRLSDYQHPNIKNESPPSFCGIIKNRKLSGVGNNGLSISNYNIPSILSCSAFKPVVASAAIVSTSLYTRSSDSNRNVNIQNPQSTRTTTVLTHNCITAASHQLVGTVETNNEIERANYLTGMSITNNNFLENPITSDLATRNADDNDDDDEVVDIETTEEESKFIIQQLKATQTPTGTFSESECTNVSQTTSTNIEGDVDVDVDGVTTDTEDQLELSFWQAEGIKISSEVLHKNSESCSDGFKNTEEAKGFDGHMKILTRRKVSKTHLDTNISKKGIQNCINGKYYSKYLVCKDQPNRLQIQKRVSLPVFVKSQMQSFRPRQSFSLIEPHKWSCPVRSYDP